jgi:hypothetical protein
LIFEEPKFTLRRAEPPSSTHSDFLLFPQLQAASQSHGSPASRCYAPAEQLPLPIHFLLPTQGKSVQALVMPDITEYRLHRRKSLPVQTRALVTVDAFFHTLRVRQRRSLMFVEERNLAHLRFIRMAQSLCA